MARDTSLAMAVRSIQDRYDASCKRVLSERQVLARIMCGCMGEFRGMDPDVVAADYIEGDPRVGADPVDRDMAATGQVRALDAEDETLAEGTVYFDIRYEAKSPSDRGPLLVEVDMEAQKNFSPGYPLLKRAVFYGEGFSRFRGRRSFPAPITSACARRSLCGSALSRGRRARIPSRALRWVSTTWRVVLDMTGPPTI